ncbi:MAG: alpha/beta hydrolase-fold protein [Anaerolineales bacterium]
MGNIRPENPIAITQTAAARPDHYNRQPSSGRKRAASACLDGQSKPAYTSGNRRPRRPAEDQRVGGVSLLVAKAGLLALFVLLTFGSASCTSSAALPDTPTPPAITPSPLPPATATPSSTPTDTPTPIPSPTRPACLDRGGEITFGIAEGPTFSRATRYIIYFPPCYAESPEASYPTIYLLHGIGYSENQWIEMGIAEIADALIASGQLPPLMIVMPAWDNRTEIEGNIVDGMVPLIEEITRAQPGRDWRAVGGISRGGGWGFRIALKYPETFASAGLHSPAFSILEMFALGSWIEPLSPDLIPRVWIDIGEEDPLLSIARQIAQTLDDQGVPYTWRQGPGSHNAEYWQPRLEEYMRWYAEPWLPSQ